jgi:opacity protein-like surface antigen
MRSHHVRGTAVVLALGVLGVGGAALADGLPGKPKFEVLPGTVWEVGTRVWYSTGSITKDLYDTSGTLAISRLTYDDLTAYSAEGFFRGDHWSGLFLKGYIGGGSVIGGRLNDEDFPPVTIPYSSTLSDQKDGNLTYWSIDLGYTFWDTTKRGGGIKDEVVLGPGHRLGAFIGYHYWRERVNTYGCSQLAASPICVPSIPGSQNVLDNEATWRSLRLGMVGDWYLTPRVRVTGEVAYVRTQLDNIDLHNLRPDIKGVKEDGTGDGVQAEIVVSYAVTDALSVGVGGRYWYMRTDDGHTHFENTAAGGAPQVVKYEADRYGVFLQGTYKLNGVADGCCASVKDAPAATPFAWRGFYFGVNAGYGWGATDVGVAGLSPLGDFHLDFEVPIGFHYDTGGFVGGVQAGYNVQMGRWVLGVEADIDYARISGTESITLIDLGVFNTTAEQRVSWLGTVRGRAGILPMPSLLLYGTAGLAYGETRLRGGVVQFGAPCGIAECSFGSASGVSTGWTAGAGFEYALDRRTSIKGEYLFVDLGDKSVNVTAPLGFPPANYRITSDFDFHLLRAGLNFKF